MTAPAAADPGVSDPPGWYCFSIQPRLAEWDGVAWTGTDHAAMAGPILPGPPTAFAFVGQPWFRWMLIGQVLCILPAILSGSTGSAWWSCISIVGYVAFMGGAVLLVGRFLELDQLEGRRALTWIGIASGVVAFGAGFGTEVLSNSRFGLSTTLWLTGPIEEGGKLLVPFLLLAFGAPRFKVPRVGLYLVLVCAATVGVIEGVEYEVRPAFPWAHLEMALVRPSAELLHVFVTGFAAAIIWLAAWRRKRAVTVAGAVAFLIAVGIHSLHDGIITLFHVDPRPFNSTLAQTVHDAIDKGVPEAAYALVVAALLYLLARHATRELTAPGDIATCPPPWRPQIKSWGHIRPVTRVPAVTTWSPYVSYAPAEPAAAYGSPAQYVAPAYGVPAPRPVPSIAVPVTSPLSSLSAIVDRPVTPTLGLAISPPIPPPIPPPGWYPMGGDPLFQGWWNGAAWSRTSHWNGLRWVPT